ncbi:Ureidoglycolate hydrolase [Achromobacter denitrificans]|uniref:Ureidoglycolate lyase n=1 Tax=Achromobacter denitrificans TaxID=32002 RepID=A0A6J5HXB0_ACHDE|nr:MULTISPECIES: ureidoglycolate lyase [Achromobacter]OLU08995.1 ureidoglycolate hydrolase [Achromobacter denitrificans]QKH43578.1 ureidoglycolate lyase [Achromobacter denitrificans]QKH49281.1 ureidoglycolate lyase [Achromobacter denitrificans]QKQ50988.1 ureidoglycolate lyase [Achromobacter denitrificans]CAB3650750.1 Ureidoglycolate lyase [Achromobacter denitrificans]
MTSNEQLEINDLTPEAFRPYGWMLGKPIPDGNGVPLFSNPATDFWQEHLFNTGAGGDAELLWVNYRSQSMEIASLEKHLLTQQAIVPLTGEVIQVVASSAADGSPDLSTLAAFRVPQGQGVCMRPGCWHATRVSDAEVTCLMLTRRSTTLDLIQHLTTDAAASESAIVAIPVQRLEGLAQAA